MAAITPAPEPMPPDVNAPVSSVGAPIRMPDFVPPPNIPPAMGAQATQQQPESTYSPQMAAASAATAAPGGTRKRSNLSLMLEAFLRGFGNALGARIPDYEERDFEQRMVMQKMAMEQDKANWEKTKAANTTLMNTALPDADPRVQAIRKAIPGIPEGMGLTPAMIGEYQKELVKNKIKGDDVVAVQTVDANGRSVTKIVPKVAGTEYPAQPKAPTAEEQVVRADSIRAKMNLKQPVSLEDQAWLQAHEQTLRANRQAITINNGGGGEKGVLMAVPDGKGGTSLQRILPGQQIPSGSRPPSQEAAVDSWAMWTNPATGKEEAGAATEAPPGASPLKMPAQEVRDVMNARHAVTLMTKRGDPSRPETQGVIQLLDSLEKDGKLGVLASRYNKFVTGGVGASPDDDPRIIALINKNMLADTAVMLAHFGAAGGRSPAMLQHFIDLSNAGKMDAVTLRAGTLAIADYMKDRAMLPARSAAQPGNGAAPEGTIIKMKDGSTRIKKSGQWVQP